MQIVLKLINLFFEGGESLPLSFSNLLYEEKYVYL